MPCGGDYDAGRREERGGGGGAFRCEELGLGLALSLVAAVSSSVSEPINSTNRTKSLASAMEASEVGYATAVRPDPVLSPSPPQPTFPNHCYPAQSRWALISLPVLFAPTTNLTSLAPKMSSLLQYSPIPHGKQHQAPTLSSLHVSRRFMLILVHCRRTRRRWG